MIALARPSPIFSPVPRRVALATMLAAATATGFALDTTAQTIQISACDPAYQSICTLPGWDDPIDDQCDVLNTGLPVINALTVPPCFPSTVMTGP